MDGVEGITDFIPGSFPGITFTAPSNLSFKSSPILRKLGTFCQQVFKVHEPLRPWHLHLSCMLFLTTYVNTNRNHHK
jgi:hypothetical protein